MHVQLSNGKLLNLTYFEDAKQGFHDKKIVVIYLTNGTKFIERFATEEEAEQEAELIREAAKAGGGLLQKDTLSDFPKTGNSGTIYIAKDTGQTYYWDKVSKTYISTGTAGRTGVYNYNGDLSAVIGATTTVKKSDLIEILKPTVDFSEGSEVIGNNSVHAIITGVNGDDVTIKTITDLTIDSFRQVATVNDLPTSGVDNILYYVQDIDEFRIWDTSENKWVEPFHPIMFKDVNVADARINTIYIDEDLMKYTIDNVNWIYLNTQSKEYIQGKEYHKDDLVYLDGIIARVVNEYTSNATEANNEDSFEKDIEDGKLVVVGGGAELERDITSNVDCGAAPKGSFFPEGMTFTEFAEKILRKDIVPTISTSFSNSGVKQVGSTINNTLMKLTITNLADVTVGVDKIDFYMGNTLVDSQPFVAGKNVYQYNYTTPITSNTPTTITAKAVLTYQTSKKAQGTGNFVFVYPSYSGVTKLATITDADATGFQTTFTKNVKTAKGYTWNNITVNDERFCYMYPKSMGALTSIIDGNGFSQMDSYTRFTVNVTDSTTGNIEPYYVYLLTDPTTGTGFKQVYA